MSNSAEYYLSRGFSPEMAAYFASGRRRIIRVVPNDDYTLTLLFDNGEVRLYDMSALIKSGTVFSPLMDLSVFRRAYIDDMHAVSWDIDPAVDSTVVWSNKIDLSPDNCYVYSTPLTGGPDHA